MRWVTCDPIGSADSLNLYEFAKNNPTSAVDRSGLGTESESSQSSESWIHQVATQYGGKEGGAAPSSESEEHGSVVAKEPYGESEEHGPALKEPSCKTSLWELFPAFSLIKINKKNCADSIGYGYLVEKQAADTFHWASMHSTVLTRNTALTALAIGAGLFAGSFATGTALPGLATAFSQAGTAAGATFLSAGVWAGVHLPRTVAVGWTWLQSIRQRFSGFVEGVKEFFWNPQPFKAVVSRDYWDRYGPAFGRSLHHWFFPQKWTWIPEGLRNAGFNLLEMPPFIDFRGGLNSWMGFASRWGGVRGAVAGTIDWFIRILIPSSLIGGGTIGYSIGTNE